MNISEIKFSSAPLGLVGEGLLGWIECTVNGSLRIEGLALRRTADGRTTLSFPARRDSRGQQHFYLKPIDDSARRDVERQIFAALGLEDAAKL
jgi:hypothetical protein